MGKWDSAKLSEVCLKITDGSHNPPKGISEESDYLMLSSKNIFDDKITFTKPRFLTQKDFEQEDKRTQIIGGDVLLTIVGTVGRVAVVPTDKKRFTVQRSVAVLKPNSQYVESRFLMYSLRSLLAFLNEGARGVAQKGIYLRSIKEINISLPPLTEQKRIVEILDEAFEGIDRAIANTEKNLANARELFDSYLNKRLLEMASQEPIQTLSCITDLIIDCEHKTAPTQKIGIPSIRTPNIGKGYLVLNDVNRVSRETYELWTKRGKPESGDLILAREAPAGNVGVIPKGETVCLGQRTVLIRPDKNSVNSQFLAFLILHPIMQKKLLSKSTGATVQHVNMKDIRKLAISQLPTIQLQQEYAKDLKKVQSESQRLEAIYQRKLEALQELKQSLLHKAFTGELTNPTVKEVAA